MLLYLLPFWLYPFVLSYIYLSFLFLYLITVLTVFLSFLPSHLVFFLALILSFLFISSSLSFLPLPSFILISWFTSCFSILQNFVTLHILFNGNYFTVFIVLSTTISRKHRDHRLSCHLWHGCPPLFVFIDPCDRAVSNLRSPITHLKRICSFRSKFWIVAGQRG